MKQRRLARLAAAGHGSSLHGAQGVECTTCYTPRRPSTGTNYREQNIEADVCGFSLPGFWLHKSEPTLPQGTGELVTPPDQPHLALLARLYHGVEATSCQAERNFSSRSFLIGTARASMSEFKVEQTMFLKLDQGCLPEVQKNNAVFLKLDQECLPEVQKNNAVVASRRNQCLQDVQSAQEAAAGETVDVET